MSKFSKTLRIIFDALCVAFFVYCMLPGGLIPDGKDLGAGGYIIPSFIIVVFIYDIIKTVLNKKTDAEEAEEIDTDFYEDMLEGAFSSDEHIEDKKELCRIIDSMVDSREEDKATLEGALVSLAMLREKCVTNEDHRAVLYCTATAYEFLKNYPLARDTYLKILDYFPDYADGWASAGNVYKEEGKYEEALSAFKNALQIAPSEEFYNYYVARELTRLGRHSEAIEYSLRELEIQKNFYASLTLLAINNTALGNYELAERYRKMARLRGADRETLTELLAAAKAGQPISLDKFAF